MLQGIYTAKFPNGGSGICIRDKGRRRIVLATFPDNAIRAKQDRFPVFFRDSPLREWYRMKRGEEMPLSLGAEYSIGLPGDVEPTIYQDTVRHKCYSLVH